MKIIDLTLPISSSMKIYPGDPLPKIFRFETRENSDWNTTRLEINAHDGTHVNFPIHVDRKGKTSDDFTLLDFFGPSVIFETEADIQEGVGIFFRDQNINLELAKQCMEKRVKFVGVSEKFEMDIESERFLCQSGMLNFESIANLEKCPKKFEFWGLPLKIKASDGSPIRAFAKV